MHDGRHGVQVLLVQKWFICRSVPGRRIFCCAAGEQWDLGDVPEAWCSRRIVAGNIMGLGEDSIGSALNGE